MNIPKPRYHLGVGSGTHGGMTAEMLIKIEKALLDESPDWVLLYGDTNSTLAGAFAAAKLNLPVAHVEAGLRSYNRRMPEEINRILTDRISSALFCPTDTAVENLEKEGIVKGVFKVGDVMYDAFLSFKAQALRKSKILKQLKMNSGNFCLATVHRQENTDDRLRLKNIFAAFDALAEKECPFVIPLHPRTRKAINRFDIGVTENPYVRLISSVSYLDMIALECHARIIFTDSGGIQKEALFAQVPCITLREETEWIETVEAGWNYLAGADTESIIQAFDDVKKTKLAAASDFFGGGKACEQIVDILISTSNLNSQRIKHKVPRPSNCLQRAKGNRR